MELSSAADAEHPQIGSEIDALGDLRAVELFVRNRHPQPGLSRLYIGVKSSPAPSELDTVTLDSAGKKALAHHSI
jgi:hypothetical protein